MSEQDIMDKKEGRLFLFLTLLIVFLIALVFWHPWLNVGSANDAFEEYYGSSFENIYSVRLTAWQPFGSEFRVYLKDTETIVGYGLINIWVDVVEFRYVWENG